VNHQRSTEKTAPNRPESNLSTSPGYRSSNGTLTSAKTMILRTAFLISVSVALLSFPSMLPAQGLELSGGYAHSTGDFGLDGFQAGGAWFFTQKIAIAADYDGLWDTSRIGAFDLTTVGAISAKNHLQNFMFGPRVFLRTRQVKQYAIIPFGEVQLGLSHLNSTIQEGPAKPLSAADTAFSWLLGAGADYSLSPHWTARLQLGLLRTHLNDQGQSRLRVGIGINYTFGSRGESR
jgi:opacity protein-like surface antigen